jgi:hypothetical protein
VLKWFGAVSVETRLAILTVATVGVVSAVDANGAALKTRQSVKFHVKPALTGMLVAVACCRDEQRKTNNV